MNIEQIKLLLISYLMRRLPVQLRGKARIARYLLNKTLEKKDTLLSLGKNQYILPSLKEPVGFHLLIDGIYEPISIDFISKTIPENGTFLDIGANIGAFSVPIAEFLLPNGKVLAVEASPKIVKYLKENIALNNLNNVTILEYAVTDKDDDEVNFYEPPSDHFGMGSIAPQFHSNPISVKTKTLDSIIKEEKISKVNVIKVDVEGYEALVFKGGEKLLTSLESPVIIFEFCDWAEERSGMKIGEAQRILRDFGYKLWKLEDFIKVKRPLPLEDILESGAEMLVGVKGGINE